MNQRLLLSVAMLMILTLGAVRPATAEQPANAKRVRPVTPAELVALGDAVADLVPLRANPYLYDEQVQRLTAIARSMEGRETEVLAVIRRITRAEVLVAIEDADRTRIALLHATPPWYGNLGTLRYESPFRAQDFHVNTSPVGIRIGMEIPLDQARRLLPGDELRIRGTILSLRIAAARSLFNPSSSAIIGNWKVVELIPRSIAVD